MADLETAIALAVEHHRGARSRSGRPYVLHPLRVMLSVSGEEARMAAVLHDTVEDSTLTLAQLRDAGFSEAVVAAVDGLTRRDGETYDAFIERCALDPLAARIKLADLEDNMNVRRLPALTARDAERLARYHRAWLRLRAVLGRSRRR